MSGRLRNRFSGIASILVALATGAGADMHFTDVTAAARITHTHSHSSLADYWSEHYSWMSGGAVAEDFDGDGWIDLYVLQGGAGPNLFYRNQGDGTFGEEAALRGLNLSGPHMGACAADYDNDGDIDLFVSSATAPHHLLINDGSGHFASSGQSFLLPASGATSPSWADLDHDGLLELALGAWRSRELGDTKIYRNIGGRLELRQSLAKQWSFTPVFADFNSDRSQDLFLVADFLSTSYYRNDGRGLLLPWGTSDVTHGMGCATGDMDGDGDLDVFVTSIKGEDVLGVPWGVATGNRLLVNDGDGGFVDQTDHAGVRNGAWGWGAVCEDFDNDGDLDLYQVNGWPDDSPDTQLLFNNTPAHLFENLGTNRFRDIAAASGDAANTGQGRCVVSFDYDNDGDQDLFIANNSTLVVAGETSWLEPGPPVLLRNDSANEHHWLKVRLRGVKSPHHSAGIGSRVYLTTGGVTQMRELNASSGYLGHGPNRIAHFGLGSAMSCDVVRAVWTNGDETEWRQVGANQAITLASPRASVTERVIAPGGQVTAAIAAADLPPGAVAEWTIGGGTYGNPASVTLSIPGSHALRLTISDGGSPAAILWSETLTVTVRPPPEDQWSVARHWNEQTLAAIRINFPNPTIHARNLFYSSVAMWDAWAAYDGTALGFLHNEEADAEDLEAARREAISYAAFRVLSASYAVSVNASTSLALFEGLMRDLGFDPADTGTAGGGPAAVGNRVAQAVLNYTAGDGSADPAGFLGQSYLPANAPLPVADSGTVMSDPNRWQPLLFLEAQTQNGQTADLIQSFVGANWGGVRPFALASLDGSNLHLDPGPPPQLGGATDEAFKRDSLTVISCSGALDPANGDLIDISPGAFGNNTLGTNDGTGHPVNTVTGLPYAPNVVKRGDFGRVLAEFWADGPHSETPPGHWNVLANKVSDSPGFLRKIGGGGPVLDRLEWDVKLYFALNAALHDAAIAAWGCKRVYDFVRPISSIRHMGGCGQSSDPGGPSYHPDGLPLVPGMVEVVTSESSAPGERHAHLAGFPGEVAIRAWSATEPRGVKWIRAVDWMPYQQATFVTPAFPGYVSGHSTFSRAGAEVLSRITGSAFFPGGLGSFTAARNEYLKFEAGPTTDIVLQWATYYDAADQAGLSRIYGGIHFPADDGPGRIIGAQCGIAAWDLASQYYDGSISNRPLSATIGRGADGGLQLRWTATRGTFYRIQRSADLRDGGFTWFGDWFRATETLQHHPLPGPSPENPRMFYRVVRSHAAP